MKDQLPENRQIYLSSISGQELDRKIKLHTFNLALHQGINLSDYGSAVHRYYCTFLVVSPEEEHHIPFEDYEEEDKEADVAIAIPYEQVRQATNEELIELLETAFLESIDSLASLSIPDFDVAAFRRDVQAIFAQVK